MVGLTLLINSDGAKDLPANDGWEIITDPNGGTNNYVEIVDSFSQRAWCHKHGLSELHPIQVLTTCIWEYSTDSPDGGIAMTGISSFNPLL